MDGSCAGSRRRHCCSATVSQSNFMNPSDSILICFFVLDIAHLAPVLPEHSRQNGFFFPSPPLQHFHMRHLIINKWENNLCHIKLYCFRFAIFMRPSWSPFDVFCSPSGAPVAPSTGSLFKILRSFIEWVTGGYLNRMQGYWFWRKWSNCF